MLETLPFCFQFGDEPKIRAFVRARTLVALLHYRILPVMQLEGICKHIECYRCSLEGKCERSSGDTWCEIGRMLPL